MSKVNQYRQDLIDSVLDEFLSGAASEENARHRLRQLGMDCEDTENALWAVKNERGDA